MSLFWCAKIVHLWYHPYQKHSIHEKSRVVPFVRTGHILCKHLLHLLWKVPLSSGRKTEKFVFILLWLLLENELLSRVVPFVRAGHIIFWTSYDFHLISNKLTMTLHGLQLLLNNCLLTTVGRALRLANESLRTTAKFQCS